MPYAATPKMHQTAELRRKWILLGAVLLSAVAGYVNVCVLGFFSVPISHMTGAVARLAIDLHELNFSDTLLISSIIGGFLVGATVSGLIIGRSELTAKAPYGAALVLEGLMLIAASNLLVQGHSSGVVLAAVACGIQNAMASSYYGLVIRTTHLTGIFTDIGVLLGQFIRYRRIEVWKMTILVGVLAGYFLGSFAGALLLKDWGLEALRLASWVILAGGVGYYIWVKTQFSPLKLLQK